MKKHVLMLVCTLGLMAGAEVWYVPGWLRCHAPGSDTMAAVQACFPGTTSIYCDWDGNGLWGTSVTNAERRVAGLVAEIEGLDASVRTNLTLVGHSLGGRIVVRALARLSEKGIVVRRGVVLAAAMPRDDADIAKCGVASREPVLFLSNPKAVTLRCFYRMAPGIHGAALGLAGPLASPPNSLSIVVPSWTPAETDVKALWGRIDLFKKVAAHHAIFYLEHLKKVVKEEN